MEDDKLKKLFSDFEPELSSDLRFMDTLRRDLNSVEIIKRHTAEVRARNKAAVAVAAAVGFIVGFLFSLSLPILSAAVSDWQAGLPGASMLYALADNFTVIAWLVIGGTSVLAAINTYEVSLTLLKPKDAGLIH
mgnify:CR=1 FL=1